MDGERVIHHACGHTDRWPAGTDARYWAGRPCPICLLRTVVARYPEAARLVQLPDPAPDADLPLLREGRS